MGGQRRELTVPRSGIGARITEIRLMHGENQKDMADRLDIGLSMMKKLELGTALPTIENLRKFKKIYRVSYDYLIDGK